MIFDPAQGFVECPHCDSAAHVERVKSTTWHCTCCARNFEGPASSGKADPPEVGRRRRTREAGILAACLLWAVTAQAQTDPRTLPRFNPATIAHAGKILIPSTDSKGTLLNYGAGAAGFSEDGTRLYIGCRQTATPTGQDGRGLIWTGTVPAVGGVSKEIAPCTGITPTALSTGLTGAPDCYFPLFGGVIQKGGRVIANGYCTYDATGNNPRKTWWSGPSFSQLSGPVEGSVKNGLVMRETSRVPAEWQALLGGDLGVSAGYTSIVSRASYGPSFSTFYAKDVSTPGFRINLLLACPSSDPATGQALPQCQSSWTHNSPPDLTRYGGSEQSAGTFIVPGTRTLAVLLREAKGPMCYGYATRTQAEHGQPYLDAVKCYSLSDPLNQKGPTGYPYTFVALFYDLTDLVAVKEGKVKPWDVKPYATHTMPTDSPSFVVGYTGSASFNSLTGTHYLFRELYPNAQGYGEVDVFTGWGKEGSTPPPPPPPPTGTLTASVTTCEAPCSATLTYDFANGTATLDGVAVSAPGTLTKTYATAGAYTHTLIVTGAAGTTPVTRAVTVTVTAQPPPPPPPPPPSCRITTEVTRAPNGSLILGATTLVCQ